MKKVCILSAVNIRHMSLISIYTDILKDLDVEVDIIYMDKYDENEKFECTNKYRYVNKINPKWPRIIKAFKYMLYLRYAENILNKNKYDFVIVWNDVAILMFADYLSKKYKGKYCLNVRDDMWYEKRIFKNRYRRVFESAAFSTISSKGYLDFLPKGINYLPIHSLNLSILEGMVQHKSIRTVGEPIRIGFIGYVRFFERNKKLLDVFANDERFELHYYGTNAHILEEYAKENKIMNTVFHDTFPVEDTKKYLEKIDIINNLYGNETINLRKAISIKFYHAAYAQIPILVCSNTYVGALAKDIGIGFEVQNINTKMKEDLFTWYTNLNFSKMKISCVTFINKANYENQSFKELVVSYLN